MEDKAKEPVYQDMGGRFMSDPNTLTTSQLLREVGFLEKHFTAEMAAVKEGIKIAHDDFVRVPTEVQKQIAALKELLESTIDSGEMLKEEKFKNIDKRLDMVEQARVEQKKDTATAVDAALKAAKEAVTEQNTSNVLAINKSEAATTKQIDQQAFLLSQIKTELVDKINDVKERQIKNDSMAGNLETLKAQVAALTTGAAKGEGSSSGRNQGRNDVMDFIKIILLIAGFAITFFVLKQ